jgi:hypothetical protein
VSRPNAEQMRQAVKAGQAMPADGGPGRFPIRNGGDLDKAIRAVGRAGGPDGTEADRAKVRRFVIKRARALGLSSLIPDTWNPDGSLKS